MTFNELMQEFVNDTYENLLSASQGALVKVMDFLTSQGFSEDDTAGALLSVIFTTVAIDGELSGLETKFVGDVTGITNPDRVKELCVSYYSQKDAWATRTDELIDAMPMEIKSSLLVLVTAFLAVDGNISVTEQRYVAKLMD